MTLIGKTLPGKVVWLFGRPCAGKTTLANSIHKALVQRDQPAILLDGDELRQGINKDLGFSLPDRHENIRRTAEMARLLASKGFWVICSLVTPTEKLRELVKQTIASSTLTMIYVAASLNVCMARDSKGHYKKAQRGDLANFTGLGSPFEEPKNFDAVIETSKLSLQASIEQCLKIIL